MTTFANLQTTVQRNLRDPDELTFSLQEIADFLNEAFAEISRLAPKRFIEDVPLSSDALAYTLAVGSSPEIEIKRVEVWDTSVTPNRAVARLQPISAEYEDNSQAGWEYFMGQLRLTNAAEAVLVVGTHQLKVWGYAPWVDVDIASGAGTDQGLSNELEKAALAYCRMTGFDRLVHDRSLFAQWQGAVNNADASPASVLSAYAQAKDDWRRLSRAISVLR